MNALSYPHCLQLLMVLPWSDDPNGGRMRPQWAAHLAGVDPIMAIYFCNDLAASELADRTPDGWFALSPSLRPLVEALREGSDVAGHVDAVHARMVEAANYLHSLNRPQHRTMVELMLTGPQSSEGMALACQVTDRQIRLNLDLMRDCGFLEEHRDGRGVAYGVVDRPLLRTILECVNGPGPTEIFADPGCLRLLTVLPFHGDKKRKPVSEIDAASEANIERDAIANIVDEMYAVYMLEMTNKRWSINPKLRPLVEALCEPLAAIAKELDALQARQTEYARCLHSFTKPIQRRMAHALLSQPRTLEQLADACELADEFKPFAIDPMKVAKMNLEMMDACGLLEINRAERVTYRLQDRPAVRSILEWATAHARECGFLEYDPRGSATRPVLPTTHERYLTAYDSDRKGDGVKCTAAYLDIVCIDPNFELAHTSLMRLRSGELATAHAEKAAQLVHARDPYFEQRIYQVDHLRAGRMEEGTAACAKANEIHERRSSQPREAD